MIKRATKDERKEGETDATLPVERKDKKLA